jgi:hypothetical protein
VLKNLRSYTLGQKNKLDEWGHQLDALESLLRGGETNETTKKQAATLIKEYIDKSVVEKYPAKSR